MVGLDAARITTLTRGGPPGALRFLYPYDGTVFPRGLAAPVLMWDDGGQPVDAVHVYIHSTSHGFRGCFKPEAPGRLSLPQAAWEALAAQTRGKADPYQIELTLLRGASATGPIRESVVIAPGTLKGSVFYNSYASQLGKKAGAPGGVILRIPPGGQAEVFVGQRACAGCHALSADGSRLVTNEAVYALTPDSGVNPPPLRAASASFPGVYPDGSVYAQLGQMVETDTGKTTLATGLPNLANQISFSPDGQWLAFTGGLVISPSTGLPLPPVGLTLMRFDSVARNASDPKHFPAGPVSLAWPNILPDNRAIVAVDALTNDLMLIDVQRGSVSLLAHAMGFRDAADAKANKTFLPFGLNEWRAAFYPTVAPVSAGGYFWVYFDSPRRYGNMDTRKIESGLTAPTGININLSGATPGTPISSRQLWVSAIEIAAEGDYSIDRSAPAFYLPGQEIGTNNHRAFSALDPCRDKGASCQSGVDCCQGFCSAGQCVVPPPRCSMTEEACGSSADCCDPDNLCINHFCSEVVLL